MLFYSQNVLSLYPTHSVSKENFKRFLAITPQKTATSSLHVKEIASSVYLTCIYIYYIMNRF